MIDFVIPFVDCSEEKWLEQYKETRRKLDLSADINELRYRSWDNLKYIFRGIAENMPYVRKIHLIVSNIEQVPSWVDKEKINIVLHKDIIPEEFLPTFNSCTIEMFIGNIKDLSNVFVYSNDDLFILNKINENELFFNGKLKIRFNKTTGTNSMYKTVLFNCFRRVATLFGRPYNKFSYGKSEHSITPMLKKDVIKCSECLEDSIYNSCTKFREEKNFNQSIFSYFSYFNGNTDKETERQNKYIDFLRKSSDEVLEDIRETINDKKTQVLCINDNKQFSKEEFEKIKNTLNSMLEERFPDECCFEKEGPDINSSSIDFVFPYVTSDDPYWQKIYKENVGNYDKWSAGIERFRDSGTLKYLFRGLEKYLPWVDKVHMLVSSKSQVPRWINRDNVNIITHEEFIPKKILPVFNSTCIEMFLPKLKNVAEKFIYSNDDLFIFKQLEKDFFFKKESLPSYQISLRNVVKTAPGDVIRRNCYNLITEDNTNKTRVVTTQHGTISYRMSWIKECYNKYEDKILESCTKFRENKNFNQYVYAFYQMYWKSINNSEKKVACFVTNKKQMQTILDSNFDDFDFVCINDDNNTTKEEWKKIIEKLDYYLPNKSKYEL